MDRDTRDREGNEKVRGGHGEAHGADVTPEPDKGAPETPPDVAREIPIGRPVPEEEFRRLKEQARRPGSGDSPPTKHPPKEEDSGG